MNDGQHGGPVGRAAPITDAEIVTAARRVFLDRGMVRPGPGLLPFGRRARNRRHRRHEIADEHARRRRELAALLRSRRADRGRVYSSAPRQRSRTARVGAGVFLALVALTVLLFGFSHESRRTVTGGAPASASAPSSTSVAGTQLTPTVMMAVSGPDRTSPTAVMSWWLTQWCPFDYRDDPASIVGTARSAMSAEGWQQFSTQQTTALLARWPQVEQGRQTARCEHVRAARSLEARPAVDGTVVVIAIATRTVSSPGRGWFTETVVAQRRVVPVGAGWLVDVAERGV